MYCRYSSNQNRQIPALGELKFKWRRHIGVVSGMKKMIPGKVDEEGRGEELFR